MSQRGSLLWIPGTILVRIPFVSASYQIYSLIVKIFHHERQSSKKCIYNNDTLLYFTGVAKIQNAGNTSVGEGVELRGPAFIFDGDAKCCGPCERWVGGFLQN